MVISGCLHAQPFAENKSISFLMWPVHRQVEYRFFFTGLYGNLDVLCFYPDEKLKGSGGRVRYCRPCRPHGTFDFRSVFENLFFFLNKIAVWTTNVSLNVNMEKKVLIYLQFTFLSMYSPVWRGYVVGRVTYT